MGLKTIAHFCISKSVLSLALSSMLSTATYAVEFFKDRSIPNNAGMQLKTDNCNQQTIEAVSKIGSKWIRRGFYFNKVNPKKDTYVFDYYDNVLDHADKQGLNVLGCLAGDNKIWENDGKGGIQTAEGRKGFAAFAAALAKRYKGRNIIWEVWNEPNTRTFWRKDKTAMHNSPDFAKEYTDLVRETVQAMLKEDPDVWVAAGSVSAFWKPSYQWTDECFKNGMGKTGIKIWSVHPYGVKTPEEFSIGYNAMRAVFKKYKADDLIMINSERGFAIKLKHEGWSGGDPKEAKEYQSWMLVRQHLIDLMNDVPLTIWYEWGAKDFGLGLPTQKHPSWGAYETMVAELSGFTFVKRLDIGAELDYVLLFTNKSGDKKAVVWAAPPPKKSPNEFTAHEVSLPFSAKRVVDVYGKDAVATLKKKTTTLTLVGAPHYIDVK